MKGWLVVASLVAAPAWAQQDPVGIWNLRIRVGNIGEGVRTVLVQVERTERGLSARASGVTADLRDVEDLTFADGVLRFATGAYQYELAVKDDAVTGTVTSPAGRQEVTGSRQAGLGYGGDVPEVLRKTWTGVVGHRVDGVPPAGVDAAAWLTARVKAPADLVIWQRRVAVGFVNADRHQAALLAQAGKAVAIDGAWRVDKIEIAGIRPAPAAR